MGTNYYLYKEVCKVCGRGDSPLHIGKSSVGWCFSLHVIPEEGINDLTDWEKLWSSFGVAIKDEYGTLVSPSEMRTIITERKWPKNAELGSRWYKENNAERGPNGLARHHIDGSHCIGHGEGTWDLIIGEFS